MHYDPFQNQLQTNPTLGSYYGAPVQANPFSAGAQGGINPQQLAILALVAQQLAWQQQHSPYAQLGHIGYQPQQFQGGYPQQLQQFGQLGNPYNQQQQIGNLLAPQSWVGQGNSPYGQQIQLAGRPYQGPWGW